MILEVPDFDKTWRWREPGKGGRRWQRRDETIPVVTVVTRGEANRFLGVRTVQERVAHLRGLRALGVLVHEHNKLTQRVRDSDGRRVKAYCFRGYASQVPRRRRRRRRGRDADPGLRLSGAVDVRSEAQPAARRRSAQAGAGLAP